MRLVVKIGTQVISTKTGLDLKRMGLIVAEIAKLIKLGHEVILVSSGAIRAGPSLASFPGATGKKIAASIGQPMLMHSYINETKKYNMLVGQVLILSEDFANKKHHKELVENLEAMLANKVTPIINENDVMKRGDLRIGDNDYFSALVAVGLKADKLVILTNQEGLFTANPDEDKEAKLIKVVKKVDAKIEKLCSPLPGAMGRGGMITKVKAAKYATEHGIETFIGKGNKRGVIFGALRQKNNFPGTVFLVSKKKK